jgi:hypothetical protein
VVKREGEDVTQDIQSIKSALQEISAELKNVRDALLKTQTTEYEPSKTLSNLDLQIRTLNKFYNNAKQADYFPKQINKSIAEHLVALRDIIKTYSTETSNAETAVKVLKNADVSYAYCLQFGIITFGFTEKENQRIFLEAESFPEKASNLLSETEIKFQKLQESIGLKQAEIIGGLQSSITPVKKELEELNKQYLENIASIEKVNLDLLEKIESTKKMVLEQETNKPKVDAVYNSIIEIQKTATSELQAINVTTKEAKANLESITGMKASSKEVLDDVKTFFGEIGVHEKKMLDARKEATENFTKLNTDSQSAVSMFATETKAIIDTNNKQQLEIAAHLRKAIGASLFSAFDIRRGNLRWGKWVWSALLVACVGAGIWITFLIAKDLQGVPDKAFFVKITAVIPIAFFIAFAAKQYTNERRAEEEYAFKSTISISLEPYYDLVEKIRKNHPDADPEFVKKLIYEIFDNPVKRIYYGDGGANDSSKTTGSELKSIINKITEHFTPEQVKDVRGMLDTLAELGKGK